MNPEHDHPDLTAYVLGELDAAEAARVRRLLAQSPEARHEFERLQQTIGLLQAAPPIETRTLHPRQRETVLAMSQAAAQQARNVVPFRSSQAQRVKTASPVWQFAKFAAAACLIVGAFHLGRSLSPAPQAKTVADRGPEAPSPAEIVEAEPSPARVVPTVSKPLDELFVAVEQAPTPPPFTSPIVKDEPKPAVPAPVSKPAEVAQQKPAPAPPATPAAPVIAATKPAPSPPSLKGFQTTASSTESVLSIQPRQFRPLPVPREFAGVVLASPLSPDAKPDPAPRKPTPQPALTIHSWKAEIASSPWDPSRRLMRFVAQVPVSQPGIEVSDEDYRLIAKFDPFHVQAYRLVTEKHMRPSGPGGQATRFAWYEIIPNRNFNATAERPVTLGTITIEQPRGSQPAESTPLKLIDRGQSWDDAREDYVFETAMIGWSMLLQGSENIGALNGRLVLDIAEKTKGEDARGERAKFINVVKQAQRAVGL